MVEVLVIPDGAAEPPGESPTSLERARLPALDALCAAGAVRRIATTPPGLPAGSETGIPTLLGARLAAPVSRGLVEAAASGIPVPAGARAWRCDLPRSHAPDDPEAVRARVARRAPEHRVEHLRGHRFLLVGARRPRVDGLYVWADGTGLPRILDHSTVVVCGPGAAAGCARLLGAQVVIPAGATGRPGTDLGAKVVAAVAAIERGARRVVVHVGAPDEAAHDHEPRVKVKALEAIDALVVDPLAQLVSSVGGVLTVCPDHGADPLTGTHDGSPVPAVSAGDGLVPSGPDAFSERAVAGLPVDDPAVLWAASLEAVA